MKRMLSVFLMVVLFVGLSTNISANSGLSLTKSTDNSITKQDLASMFPEKNYREESQGSYVFYEPRLRIGETRTLCGGLKAKMIVGPIDGKPMFVHANDFLVTFKNQKSISHAEANKLLAKVGTKIGPGSINDEPLYFHVLVPQGKTVEEMISEVKSKLADYVKEVMPYQIYYTYYTPSDPKYSDQWQWPLIQMEDAWNITFGDPGTAVCINDSGVSLYTTSDGSSHSDSKISSSGTYEVSKELYHHSAEIRGDNTYELDPGSNRDLVNSDNYPADDFGHGTFISNLVFGDMDDNEYGCGEAPELKILPIKAGGCDGMISSGDTGINDAVSWGAKVVSCSYGSHSSGSHSAEDNAWDSGVIVVAASGNEGNTTDWQVGFPAGYVNVLAVGACTSSGSRAGFSCYGWGATKGFQDNESGELFIMAPGQGVYNLEMQFSSYSNGSYQCGTADPSNQTWTTGDGTSYACPIVSGAIGLMYSLGASDPQTIKTILAQTADHTSNGNVTPNADSALSGTSTYSEEYGHGLLQVADALNQVTPAPFIIYASKTISDSTGGDGDGIPEAGETVDINVTLKNTGKNDPKATLNNGQAVFSTDDYYANITDDTSNYPDIAGQSSQAANDPFTVEINQYTPNLHEIEFTMEITGTFDSGSKNYSTTRTFRLTVGSSDILVIDYDSGAAVNGYSVMTEKRIEDALSKLNWTYAEVWQVPSDFSYNRFKIAFVTYGNYAYYSPARSRTGSKRMFSNSELDSLKNFLDGGGNLYMEGAGQSASLDSTEIWPYFGTNHGTAGDTYGASTNISNVSGVAGTAGAGLGSNIGYENNTDNPNWGAYTNSYNTTLTPTNGTGAVTSNGNQGNGVTRVVQWNNTTTGCKTIFSDLIFAGIDTTTDDSPQRNNYMDTIMDFFGYSTNPTDTTAPAKTTLSGKEAALNEGVVNLSWLAPGDDGWCGWNDGGSYQLQYSLNQSSWTDVSGEPNPPKHPKDTEGMNVSGLTAGNTYYFRIRTVDEASNYSDWSDVLAIYLNHAPSCWGGPNYPGPKILLWVEGSPDELGYSKGDGDRWVTGIGQLQYAYERKRTAHAIGDLKGYNVVIYVGGACNHSNHQSFSESIPNIEDYLDNGTNPHFHGEGFLYIYNESSKGNADNPSFINNYTGIDDSSVAVGSTQGNLSGQSGTYMSGVSYGYSSIGDFGSACVKFNANSSGKISLVAASSQNAESQWTPDSSRIFNSLQLGQWSNVSDSNDYVNKVFSHFGYTGMTDSCPPGNFTVKGQLTATQGVRLTWKSPGDDGLIGTSSGAPASYEVRYSTDTPFNTSQFSSQTQITSGVPTPQVAGNEEEMFVSGLTGGKYYYFMVKATDDNNNSSYSNCAEVYMPNNSSKAKVLVFDYSNPGLTDFGLSSGVYDGVNDAGQVGDPVAAPWARTLRDLGYAVDYKVDSTTKRGNAPGGNNTSVLPDLTQYDAVFLCGYSRGNTDMLGPTDQDKINTFLHTDGKRFYQEDWLITEYESDDLGGEASYWDSTSADVNGIYYDDDGQYIYPGVLYSAEGADNPFGILKNMKFLYDNKGYTDFYHSGLGKRADTETYSMLNAVESRVQYSGNIPKGTSLAMAHWRHDNIDVKTIVTGSFLAGLNPYDDQYYADSTFKNVVRNIMTWFGFGGEAPLTSQYPILSPEWGEPSVAPNNIYYIRSHYGSNIALMVAPNAGIDEKSTPSAFTHVSSNIHHASNITIGGNYIYYGNYNAGENGLEIYRVPEDDSAAATAYYPHLSDGHDVVRWHDPDYIAGGVFADGKPRIICGHNGDLVAYVANDDPTTVPALEAVRLTSFPTDPQTGSEANTWVYQPKWSPDGDSVIFVLRPPTAKTAVAKTGIYIINGIKDIIAGNTGMVTSLTDSRVTTVQKYGQYVCWSPSFSGDGSTVVFARDENDAFNNWNYANLGGSYTGTFFNVMDGTNFAIYKRDMTDSNIHFASKVSGGTNIQAFLEWAKEGGDKVVNSNYNPATKQFTLNIQSDFTNTTDTTKNRDGEIVNEVKDRSNASIYYKGDLAEYALRSIRIEPVMKRIYIPTGYKYFGASRLIVTDPIIPNLPNNTEIKLGFNKTSVAGIDLNNYKFNLYYIDNKGKMTQIPSTVLRNDYTYYLYGRASKPGTYAVLAAPKASIFSDLSKVRVFPSLIKNGKDDSGDAATYIAIDKLPDNVSEINVYNIAGERVAAIGNGVIFAKTDEADVIDYANAVHTGAEAKWNLTNENGKEIASGLYIIVIKLDNGKSIYRKVAVVR